ncbi:hypothetical protein [Sphingobium chungbukense]|nr:hypothetical protein [Sphingobium chungbukense]
MTAPIASFPKTLFQRFISLKQQLKPMLPSATSRLAGGLGR